jgi:hypothetical protein
MVHWGKSYGVYIERDGKKELTWFKDYDQACQVEAKQLYGNVGKKLAAGQTVVLTTDQWRQANRIRP